MFFYFCHARSSLSGIQKGLTTLDSRFRGNDDFLWKYYFINRLYIAGYEKSLGRKRKR
jgi:hypothetical protein